MVGRNDPCPCGSGKKYKRCCAGKNEEFLEQQVGQDLNRIIFDVFKDVSKKIDFKEFESFAKNWKEELESSWDMKSIEETISAYYIFVARQDLWTDYLSDILSTPLRTAVRDVAETWERPIVLLGKVTSEEEEFLEIQELYGDGTYLLKKNQNMIGSTDAVVYGIVLPDSVTYPNGIRVISSLMIVRDHTDVLKNKIDTFVKLNNIEQNPIFFKTYMLDIYTILLGKPVVTLDSIAPREAAATLETAITTESEASLETVATQEAVSLEAVTTSETPVELIESDLTPIQLETIELLKKVLIDRGAELETQELLENICVSYFAKEQPNFRKANVVAAGVFRAALDSDLLNEEAMTNNAVAKLFNISPASMSKHADAVRELIPEIV